MSAVPQTSSALGEDGRPLADELLVGDARAEPRALLDEDLVAARHQLADPDRGDRDAVLVDLDLPGNADLHRITNFLATPAVVGFSG